MPASSSSCGYGGGLEEVEAQSGQVPQVRISRILFVRAIPLVWLMSFPLVSSGFRAALLILVEVHERCAIALNSLGALRCLAHSFTNH